VATLSWVSLAISAHAQVPPLDRSFQMPATETALDWYERHDSRIVLYLKGLTDGIYIANAAASEQREVFCLPDDKESPSVDTAISMVRVLVAKAPEFKALPIGIGLQFALHAEFPCPK
jgi:hypothetical protein